MMNVKSYKRKLILVLLTITLIIPSFLKAQEVDFAQFDKAKILELMDMVAYLDPSRPGFKGDSAKFEKEHSDLYGGFSDVTIDIDKTYYGIFGGLKKTIHLTFTKPGVLTTYGGENTLNIKTSAPLVILVSGGQNKFKVEKINGFTGDVHYVTHYATAGTYEGGSQMSFAEFWQKYRK